MENNDLLWAKKLSLELTKLVSQTPKSGSPVFLDQTKEFNNPNVKSPDFQSEEKGSELIKNQTMGPFIQLSYYSTKIQTENGFKLVKSFPADVISLRDFLNSSSETSLNLIIDFTQNLLEAVHCFYEFETIHNDVRIENICFNTGEKRFKLVPTYKSLQGWEEAPSAFDQDKLGFLLVLFEVANVVLFDEFNPEKLKDYLEKLVAKSSPEFVEILHSAQLTEHIGHDQIMKIYQDLRQSQDEQIAQAKSPTEKSVHPKKLDSIPSLKMLLNKFYPEITEERFALIERNLRSEKIAYALGKRMQLSNINTDLIEELCTKAKKFLGFEESEAIFENKMFLKYPSPEEINELSVTLKFVKEYLHSVIAEFERFESNLRSNTIESTQNKEIFLKYPNSKKINERYEERQQKQFFHLWNEAEEKIHQLAAECLSLSEKLISQELRYFLFSEAKQGKYPDPEEMQKLSSNAKQFFAYMEVITGIWKKLQGEVKERTKEGKEIDLKEIVSILHSEGGKEKEILIPGLIEIKTLNEVGRDDASPVISTYYHNFVNLTKKVNRLPYIRSSRGETEHYASGCVLNYHFWCLKNIKSNQDILNIWNQGNHIIDTYGSDLGPHQLYRIHRTIPDQETLRKSEEIMSSIQAQQNSDKLLFNILNQLANDLETQLILSEREGQQELDSLHVLGTGSLSEKFLKVTLTDLDEKDFQKMAEEPAYAEKIYHQFKEAVRKSRIFRLDQSNKVEIVAIECNSPPTAVILIGSNIVQSIDQSTFDRNVIIRQTPIIKYLKINMNHFDTKGDMEWGENHIDSEPRGGLDYFFPKGWKGYGLKVLGLYPDPKCPDDTWLTKPYHTGWAVGYHGVGSGDVNPGITIGKILGTRLIPGTRQLYETDRDVSPFAPWLFGRAVGKGIYFGKTISISESGYTSVVTLQDGSQYKVLLQCRLNPREVRVPKSKIEYYVVPEGHARPYRILVKEVKAKDSSKPKLS